MRTRRFLTALICGILIVQSATLFADDVTYYVPFVKVLSATIPGDTGKGPSYVYWVSTVAAFNNSATPATLSYRTAFGTGVSGPFPYCFESKMPPFAGVEMENVTGGCTFASPNSGPGFVLLTTSNPGVIVGADVQRVISVAGCGGGVTIEGSGDYNLLSQGSSPLPVYKSLMAANATAVAGPVDLGAIDHPESCITGPFTHRRRVNVMLFNGGLSDAVFTVVGRSLYYRADPIFQTAVVLRAQEVKQLNSISIPVNGDSQFIDAYDVRVWLSITATQPFLAYVTTIFEGGEPGSNAVTVYEAHASN